MPARTAPRHTDCRAGSTSPTLRLSPSTTQRRTGGSRSRRAAASRRDSNVLLRARLVAPPSRGSSCGAPRAPRGRASNPAAARSIAFRTSVFPTPVRPRSTRQPAGGAPGFAMPLAHQRPVGLVAAVAGARPRSKPSPPQEHHDAAASAAHRASNRGHDGVPGPRAPRTGLGREASARRPSRPSFRQALRTRSASASARGGGSRRRRRLPASTLHDARHHRVDLLLGPTGAPPRRPRSGDSPGVERADERLRSKSSNSGTFRRASGTMVRFELRRAAQVDEGHARVAAARRARRAAARREECAGEAMRGASSHPGRASTCLVGARSLAAVRSAREAAGSGVAARGPGALVGGARAVRGSAVSARSGSAGRTHVRGNRWKNASSSSSSPSASPRPPGVRPGGQPVLRSTLRSMRPGASSCTEECREPCARRATPRATRPPAARE